MKLNWDLKMIKNRKCIISKTHIMKIKELCPLTEKIAKCSTMKMRKKIYPHLTGRLDSQVLENRFWDRDQPEGHLFLSSCETETHEREGNKNWAEGGNELDSQQKRSLRCYVVWCPPPRIPQIGNRMRSCWSATMWGCHWKD